MARGRDLTISILSDLDKFETEGAARDLEALGKAAEESGRELDALADDAEKVGKDLRDAADEAEKGEKGLEDLGRSAEKAGRDLKEISDSADKVERDLKDLGDSGDKAGKDFQETARKIDAAFDKIASSSRSNLRKVDDEARKAGKGMDDFKSEVDQTGRESAASFTGSMDDITDSLQEVSANALSAFGPAGAFVGIAAAAALGTIVSALQTAADEANEAKEATSALADEIIEAGGSLDQVDFEGRMRSWSLEIADNVSWWEVWQKEAVTNVEQVQRAMEDGSRGARDFLGALSSSDTERLPIALRAVTSEIEDLEQARKDYLDTFVGQDLTYDTEYQALLDSIDARKELVPEIEKEIKARQDAAEQAEVITKALIEEDWARQQASENFGNYRHEIEATNEQLELSQGIYASLDGSLDGHASAVEAAARRVEEETGKAGDSWEDYKSTAVVGLDDVETAMDEQIVALTNFNSNIETLAQQGGDAYVAAAYEMADEYGVPVEQMAQYLVDAPAAKQEEIVAKHQQIGRLSGEAQQQGTAQGMRDHQYKTHNAAVAIYDDVEGVLSQDITMPTKVSKVGAGEVEWVRADAQRRAGSINIPVNLVRGSGHMRDWL